MLEPLIQNPVPLRYLINRQMAFGKKVLFIASIPVILIALKLLLTPNILIRVKHHVMGVSYALNEEWLDVNKEIQVDLQYSPNVTSHFKGLYRGYGDYSFKKDCLATYLINNKWQDALLVANGKSHKVKIKNHGRSPRAHVYGNHFSLGLKSKEELFEYGGKRLNLVVYNRLQISNSILQLFSSKFELPMPLFKLLVVNVSSKGQGLYYLEERIGESYFKRIGWSCLIFNKGENGVGLYHSNKSKNKLDQELTESLEKLSASARVKSNIRSDFKKFNSALKNVKVDSLAALLDLKYMTRLMAFREVYGCNGHGFGGENFNVAYDTIHRKFYPLVHRDVFSSDSSNRKSYGSPIFEYLMRDSTIASLTQKEIKKFLGDYSDSDIENEILEVRSRIRKVFLLEHQFLNNNKDGRDVLKNIKLLRNEHSIVN